MDKEEALKRGYNWQDSLQRTVDKETIKPGNIPDSINDVNESILNEVLICTNCKRNYKIVQNEFNFYKTLSIPIPRKCFFCRHADRIAKRNPFRLWHRKCMKAGCPNEFETSYAPDPRYAEGSGEARRPEIVYCEKCYQSEVY